MGCASGKTQQGENSLDGGSTTLNERAFTRQIAKAEQQPVKSVLYKKKGTLLVR